MPNLEQFSSLAFLALFQIIGGVAVGSGLRTLLVNHSPAGIFLVIWGLIFGGGPALASLGTTAGGRFSPLLFAGPAVFIGAVLFSLFLLPSLVQLLGAGNFTMLAVGTAFLFFGVFYGVGLLRAQQGLGGLFFSGIFVIVGALLCGAGILTLINGKPPAETS